MTRPLFIVVTLFLATAAVAALSGCATNPVTGSSDFVLMSERQEIDYGRKADPEIRQQYGVYDDAALQAYVQRVGARLAGQSHRPELVYHFTVLDSDQVNAFALPGGYIYVTRGILAYLNSEAELAAVLGHEIGHVTARHSVVQVSKAQGASLGFEIGSIFLPELRSQAVQSLFNVLGSAILSGYGRDNELQSDRLGAEYLARSGFDPDAMIEVVGVLKNQEEAEKKRAQAEGREARVYHGVFASHPSADQRLQEVVAEARKFKTGTSSRVAREEYLKQLDQLVFGDSAREGVRRGADFYHRALDLGIRFPSGWRLENTPKAVNAHAPDKSAMMQFVMEDLGKRLTPQEYLRGRLKSGAFTNEGKLEGSTLPSHTAIVRLSTPYGVRNVRVVVLLRDNRAFTFFGTARDDSAFRELDAKFLATAKSLHALAGNERAIAEGLRLRIVKARAGDSFAALAKRAPLNDYAELTLRLINAKFPSGEPVPGELIKIIE
jgi:predicted Zn-dependent protease